MKKILAIVFAAMMLLSSVSAMAEADKPYAGTTISVLVQTGSTTEFMKEHVDEFTAETGINVEFEQLSNDQINTKILVSMGAGGSDLDVINYMAYQNGKMYVQNGWLEPLNPYFENDAEFDIDDFMAGCLSSCKGPDGTVYGIPHGSAYGILFYNKEMVAEAGIDVTAIKTYDDLVAACKTVEEKLPGVAGIGLRGNGNAAVALVPAITRAYGGDFLDAEGNAAVNTPEFCAGVEVYRNLLEYAQDGYSAMNFSEVANVFGQKKCCFVYDTTGLQNYLIDPNSSLVGAENLGFLSLPAGPVGQKTWLANWGIGISSGSQNKEASWEFIRWMESKEALLLMAKEQHNEISRTSVAQDPEVAQFYAEGWMDVIIESGSFAEGGSLPNVTAGSEARAAIGEALDSIFAGGDIQENLDEANEIVQELIEEFDK